MSFWNSQFVQRGRKDYRCYSCAQPITAGSSSYVESGLLEGDFVSSRLCPPCHAFIKRHLALGNLPTGEPFEFDCLPDIAEEAGEPWPPASRIEARSDATGTGAAEGESLTAEGGDAQ